MGTSEFMNESLKQLFDKFSHNVEKYGMSNAVGKLKDDIGLTDSEHYGKNSEKFINGLEREYIDVKREDAVFFMQECSNVMAENYKDSIDIEDKKKMLEVVRNGDLPTEMSNKICIAIANEALEAKDRELFEVATIQADGITAQDYEELKEDASICFGMSDAERAELIIKLKDNPEKTFVELTEKLESKEIEPLEYVERMALINKDLPKEYKEEIGLTFSVDVQNLDENGEPTFVIDGRDGLIEEEYDAVKISDERDTDDLDFSVKKEDAIKTIQKYQIKSDNVMDCICEVNVPPTDPLFASELAQKLAGYISAQHIPAGNTDNEKHILSSILPDDQKASFDARFDEITKEHNDEITTHFNRGDRDFDEKTDFEAVEETDMQYDNEPQNEEIEEEIDEI